MPKSGSVLTYIFIPAQRYDAIRANNAGNSDGAGFLYSSKQRVAVPDPQKLLQILQVLGKIKKFIGYICRIECRRGGLLFATQEYCKFAGN